MISSQQLEVERKLVLELAHALHADIITTELNKENLNRIKKYKDIRIINLGNCIQIPILKQLHSSWKFHRADFKDSYDLYIMTGNWSIFAARNHRPTYYTCSHQ